VFDNYSTGNPAYLNGVDAELVETTSATLVRSTPRWPGSSRSSTWPRLLVVMSGPTR
jgi:hypothetical protein